MLVSNGMRTHPCLPCAVAYPGACAYPGSRCGTWRSAADSRNMEAMLVESMLSVSNNKLDVALNEVDSLLKINPNFKLAQLIKGDLLLARARPLSDFGNAPDAAATRWKIFAMRRVFACTAFRNNRPSTLIPKFLWQLDSQQRHVIVVDLSKSTLYLYENVDGEPRYVADYYISFRQKRLRKIIRRRPENSARRIFHQVQPAQKPTHRSLRQRCLPAELPE